MFTPNFMKQVASTTLRHGARAQLALLSDDIVTNNSFKCSTNELWDGSRCNRTMLFVEKFFSYKLMSSKMQLFIDLI